MPVERRAAGKQNASSEERAKHTSAAVPAAGKQGEEDLWQRHKAERGVWSEKMLVALERGSKETSGSV